MDELRGGPLLSVGRLIPRKEPAMGRSKRPLQDEVAVKVKRVGNAVIVLVSGDLARSTTEQFEGTLREAIDGRKLDVVLELGDVRLIDSTGLRSLLRIANQC